MSRELISRSPDLKRLRDEGYFVQVRGGFLVMRDVPYVDASRHVRTGVLISSLTLAGDQTRPPDTHVVHFDGDYPCLSDGTPIHAIAHQTGSFNLGEGLTARHSFSSKPAEGYPDYFAKMTTYAGILSGPAATLEPHVTPRTFRAPDEDETEESIFNYRETASARVGITHLTEHVASERIAIIGLGGTGSYVLDFVAKTPVREIRLFDGDEFLQHNAFRAPGAPSIEDLRDAPLKVAYLKAIYSRMHRAINAYPVRLDAGSLHLLDGITFAFVCMDAGDEKRAVVDKLEALNVPFIDVGMGLELTDGSLGGVVRTTVSTPERRDIVRERVSFAAAANDDVYASNIQVADLNALNAVLAVVKWKKLRGFYRDIEREHHCSYTTDGNLLLNEELG
jgi:hypothetical protein